MSENELEVTEEEIKEPVKKKVKKAKVTKKSAKKAAKKVIKELDPEVEITFIGEGGKWDSKLGGMLYFFKKGVFITKDPYVIARMRELGFNELKV